MTTYNLSASVIKTLQPPSSGNRVFFDSQVSGFGLRVTANGARSFILNYRTVGGRERRKTIGAWPIWTATDARREAARLRHLVDQGGDPLAEVQAERSAPTMADLCDRFEQETTEKAQGHVRRLQAHAARLYPPAFRQHESQRCRLRSR